MTRKINKFPDLPIEEQNIFNNKTMAILETLNKGKRTHKVRLTENQISFLMIILNKTPKELANYLETVFDIASFHIDRGHKHSSEEITALKITKQLYKGLSAM